MKTRQPSHCQAFTLIEMIITLCVFVLLAGAVFGIFDATLQSVASLEDDQKRENRADALDIWLRHEFETLPADGIIASYHRENTPFHASDLAWGSGCSLQALDLHVQANGLYELRLTHFQAPRDLNGETDTQAALDVFSQQLLDTGAKLAWRPLIHDLSTAAWRFRAGTAPVWQDMTSGDRQAAVEFRFRIAGASAEVTGAYWIPSLAHASSGIALSAANLGTTP